MSRMYPTVILSSPPDKLSKYAIQRNNISKSGLCMATSGEGKQALVSTYVNRLAFSAHLLPAVV